MESVVDVNVILSSLISKGNSLKVFSLNALFNKFEFVAPEFMLVELEKHKEEFFKRSKLSKQAFEEVLDFILGQITIIPESEFSELISKAKELLSEHLKDVQYLALALKLGCPIFSGDKVLKELSPAKIFSPKEMLEKF
jgi:predicted nucleic acid-binding protein